MQVRRATPAADGEQRSSLHSQRGQRGSTWVNAASESQRWSTRSMKVNAGQRKSTLVNERNSKDKLITSFVRTSGPEPPCSEDVWT